jgi:hypothetical protein
MREGVHCGVGTLTSMLYAVEELDRLSPEEDGGVESWQPGQPTPERVKIG